MARMSKEQHEELVEGGVRAINHATIIVQGSTQEYVHRKTVLREGVDHFTYSEISDLVEYKQGQQGTVELVNREVIHALRTLDLTPGEFVDFLREAVKNKKG